MNNKRQHEMPLYEVLVTNEEGQLLARSLLIHWTRTDDQAILDLHHEVLAALGTNPVSAAGSQ